MKKRPFLDQNHGLTPLEKCQFSNFLNFLFLKPKKAFFGSRISWKIFAWPILPEKTKLEKWSFLDQNHGSTPLEKCQFFNFSTSCFYSLERRFFVLEYRKRYFSGPYCPKKKVGKMAIFGPKPWVKPFGKMSIFRLFQLRFFIV